ncbi:MAG: outer membrane protein assembly factor BamE [Ideonella sp.]|nr:outer membrane protein assembly factor BamE [Ideonella sp.]MCC7456326.1 hypothetical protein [Nitrospira sp.]
MARWWTWLQARLGGDAARIAQLHEGVSSEADVRHWFGEPVGIATAPDGTRTLEYPRQPEGWTNIAAVFGPDGRLRSLRQLLTPENFARVRPGMHRDELRPLLGRPAQVQRQALKRHEVWDWRYRDGQASRLFSVTLDDGGQVVSVASLDDPKQVLAGGQ